jgi:hypothetical protein
MVNSKRLFKSSTYTGFQAKKKGIACDALFRVGIRAPQSIREQQQTGQLPSQSLQR